MSRSGQMGPRVVRAEVCRADPAASPSHCSAVVEVTIEDGRRFSILSATPSWFEEARRSLGLPYYFGPQVLFVRSMEPGLVRRAAEHLAAAGDRWLCVYDTPHRTLPQVLAEFRSRHQ